MTDKEQLMKKWEEAYKSMIRDTKLTCSQTMFDLRKTYKEKIEEEYKDKYGVYPYEENQDYVQEMMELIRKW